jgi:NodT family efflux transporter outer membrane factor (OMF) lipoprotein
MNKHLAFFIAVPLVLTGCVNRDIAVKQNVALPTTFSNASLANGADVDDAAWWASFGDPQLALLVKQSLAYNRSLRAAEASVRNARAERRGAIANLLPSVGAGAKALSQETLIDIDGTTQGEAYGVSAQWDLDIFGQNRNAARAANQLAYAEEEKYLGARMTVASETAKAYLTWQNVQAREQVLREAIAVEKRMLEVVEGRLPEGMSSTFDVDRAKARLAATEALLPSLEMADAKLRGALAVLTGVPVESLKLNAGAGWAAVKVPMPPSVLPSEVLQRRPDVQAALRTVKAQMFAVGSAKAAYYPKFNFNLFAGNEYLQFSEIVGQNARGPVYDLHGAVTDMALNATLPIFTFGKIRAAVRGQEAKLDAVAALYEDSILKAVADVETSYHAYAATGRRAERLNSSAASAASALSKAQGLYEGGLADVTDVLTTQASSLDQSDAALQGALEHAVAAIALRDALGGYPPKGKSK